ncbi:MAG: sodium-dependent bicarbonate transport family permease [Pseudobdellovibrionaceae bacterium]
MGLELIQQNLISPPILAFLLGLVACLLRSDLRLPETVFQALSLYLLFAIGLKGGASLSEFQITQVAGSLGAAILLGLITPLVAFSVFRFLNSFERTDAAALAAHFGSVSAVTFMASVAFLDLLHLKYESYLPALVALMEIPGIIVAIMIVKIGSEQKLKWTKALREVVVGKSVLLLLGGFLIGLACGEAGMKPLAAFFVEPFRGVLTLFLLEMGVLAAIRFRDLSKAGMGLVVSSLGLALLHGALGALLGTWVGMSVGGATVLATMAASASYIAAPAAVKSALPEANPTYYLTASLGIVFPFNLVLGIPLFYHISLWLHS